MSVIDEGSRYNYKNKYLYVHEVVIPNDDYSEISWLSYHKLNILTSGFYNETP